MESNEQQQLLIQRQYKQLRRKVKEVSKLKGEAKAKASETLRKELKKHLNMIKSYEIGIMTAEGCTDEEKMKLKGYLQKAENLRRNLQYIKNEGVTEDDLFENRTRGNEKMEMVEEVFRVQGKSKESLAGAIRNLYEMKNIAEETNIKLMEQVERLDQIYVHLQDTESTMKRAQRHIAYLARSVYTDKILMGLIVLIVIAIIVVIILSAMGKTNPAASSDILK